jgi:hypothetical protein
MLEEKMRALTINELMRLPRVELCDLAARSTTAFTVRRRVRVEGAKDYWSFGARADDKTPGADGRT